MAGGAEIQVMRLMMLDIGFPTHGASTICMAMLLNGVRTGMSRISIVFDAAAHGAILPDGAHLQIVMVTSQAIRVQILASAFV